MKSKRLLRSLKFIVIVVSLVLLSVQLQVVLEQFLAGKTNTAISYESNKKLLLPSITVCNQRPHKESMPMEFEEDYVNNSWKLEDIVNWVS